MPIFSNVKPELKQEIENIINLAQQENVNNEELTRKCKSFFDSVFLDNNKLCVKECCKVLFDYIANNSVPYPITVLTMELSFLYAVSLAPIELAGKLDNN